MSSTDTACSVPGCDRPIYSGSLCVGHYERRRRLGDVQADRPLKERLPTTGTCVVPGCAKKRYKRGRCQPHYARGDDAVLRPVKNASICIVPRCGRPAPTVGYRDASGLCEAHQRRAAAGRSLATPIRPTGQGIDAHMAENVDRSGGPDACWPYTGSINAQGYGEVRVEKRMRRASGASSRAHRVAFEMEYGPILAGLVLDHMCHWRDPACPGGSSCLHRRCCNPRHLDAVARGENSSRTSWGACASGHPSTSQEFRVTRICRDCGDGVEHPVPLREFALWAWATYRKSRRHH